MKSSRRHLALICAALGGTRPAPAQIVADPAAAANQRPAVLAFDRSGRPIMDFKALSTGEKQLIGEARADSFVMRKIPDAIKLKPPPTIGSRGVDAIYKINRPEINYLIGEAKFGTSALKSTNDGLQMSDDWLKGSSNDFQRIFDAVEDRELAKDIVKAIREGRVEKWLTRVDPHGRVTLQVLDHAGQPLPNPEIASKILGGQP